MFCVFSHSLPFSFIKNLAILSSDSHEQQFFGSLGNNIWAAALGYLTIIPRARMGSESIAHSAFGLRGY